MKLVARSVLYTSDLEPMQFLNRNKIVVRISNGKIYLCFYLQLVLKSSGSPGASAGVARFK